jgi:hypothetical protein
MAIMTAKEEEEEEWKNKENMFMHRKIIFKPLAQDINDDHLDDDDERGGSQVALFLFFALRKILKPVTIKLL